jgi:phospholipid-binding lipoprotein MlaA
MRPLYPFKVLIFISIFSLVACASVSDQNQQTRPEALSQTETGPLAGTGIQPNVVAYSDPETETGFDDPLIRLNRAIFAFNDVSYRYVLIPAARMYQKAPAPVRTGIGNFFNNIKSPISIVNHLLQFKGREAGRETARFLINSTLGIVGIMDTAASNFDIAPDQTGMRQTLTQYGAGYGAYLVLPFIGPSNIRDGSSVFLDSLLNPLGYLDNPESTLIRVFDNFQTFSPTAEGYLTLKAESEDPYIFMRNLHLQGRLRDAQYRQQ